MTRFPLSLLLLAGMASAADFQTGASYELCFVPDGNNCQDLLVDAINHTNKQLLIQAYSFTSESIAKAIVDAKKRGVDVQVLVDKSQEGKMSGGKRDYSVVTLLQNANIPVLVDSKPAIAHNKVMVFDGQRVFTGSFNFTKAATTRNAENGIIITGDKAIVESYTKNWEARKAVSRDPE